jgi:hypothetical protein
VRVGVAVIVQVGVGVRVSVGLAEEVEVYVGREVPEIVVGVISLGGCVLDCVEVATQENSVGLEVG